MDKFKKVEPLERIDKLFKRLTPEAHRKQYKRAHETDFVIKDTAFPQLLLIIIGELLFIKMPEILKMVSVI